jgi:glycosyltransferase involved in cell wall biosynthesis
MNIVLFAHPAFLGSQSMPRFASMLMEGMQKRGCNVTLLEPFAICSRLPVARIARKWLGYIDQYVLFPIRVQKVVKHSDPKTLFVFADHALGPWVPLVANRPHVIHCHDFLAQKSAKGHVTRNRTGFSGRIYQAFIRNGYRNGKHFISISQKTDSDLHQFMRGQNFDSEVVYNPLSPRFTPRDVQYSRMKLGEHLGLKLVQGYLLHVGGNQWYKNRSGVVEIYNAWRSNPSNRLPLVLVGKAPDAKLRSICSRSAYSSDIHTVSSLEDDWMPFVYSGANALLFPSHAEGFGWPIAEAMACGCPVITTNEAPMTEAAGGAAFLIPIQPDDQESVSAWAVNASNLLDRVLTNKELANENTRACGLENSKRFDAELTMNRILAIYERVLGLSVKESQKLPEEIIEHQSSQSSYIKNF